MARVNRGLSQRVVAVAARLTQAQVSRIERGLHESVPVSRLALLATAVGLDLSIKLYPAGQPIRDKAHIALFERLRRAAGPSWSWRSEVPLPIPGDKRAWDRVIVCGRVTIGIEGEMHPTDLQELGRRVALKKRDGNVDRLILVLADTAWCRRIVRLNELASAFPISGSAALKAIANGMDPGGDAIILI
ncbi:MAG TPA: helix-turn-helix transcriptional regulator [Candidatus Dormibacteraeota bacterium]|nr:helix-turn-helix transcriptional regulator [Candidatus Dormibacteraeota bacterium]